MKRSGQGCQGPIVKGSASPVKGPGKVPNYILLYFDVLLLYFAFLFQSF